MTRQVPIEIHHRDGEPLVEFPDERFTVSVPLTQVGDRLYRLDAIPFPMDAAWYRDIVELEPTEPGCFRFVRLVEKSGWQTHDFMMTREQFDSEMVQSTLRYVAARGWHWERFFTGFIYICLPPGVEFEPEKWDENDLPPT